MEKQFDVDFSISNLQKMTNDVLLKLMRIQNTM